MSIIRNTFTLIGLLALLSAPLQAHHSTSSLYFHDQTVELTGTVKAWRFINPHPFLIIEVEQPDGSTVEWDVSYGGAAVVHLQRQGYSANTFREGEVIHVRGSPARAEGVHGILLSGNHPTREDGSQVVEGGSMF